MLALTINEPTECQTIRVTNSKDCINYIKGESLLKLFHTNIRSVSKNFNELEIVLYELETNCDIIALTETWYIENSENFVLNGYSTYYNQGKLNRNDGVIVFVENSIQNDVEVIEIGGIRCIRMHVKKMDIDFYVTIVYRPPSSNVAEFVKKL